MTKPFLSDFFPHISYLDKTVCIFILNDFTGTFSIYGSQLFFFFVLLWWLWTMDFINLKIYVLFKFYFWINFYLFSYLYWKENKLMIIIIIIMHVKNTDQPITQSIQPTIWLIQPAYNLFKWPISDPYITWLTQPKPFTRFY